MRILIVDDQADFYILVKAVLAEVLGTHETEFAESIAEALHLLATRPSYDLVISDFRFPEGTGDEIYSSLRSMDSRIPFILFTSLVPHDLAPFVGESFVAAVAKSDLSHLRKAVQHAVLDFMPAPS